MALAPKFIQGVFTYEGSGLETPKPLGPRALYQVPAGKSARLIYVRAGNYGATLATLLVTRNSRPLRYFPVGAQGAIHVSLAVNEELVEDSSIEIMFAAPEGSAGQFVVDVGLLEAEK